MDNVSTKALRSIFILSKPLTLPFQQPAEAGLLKKTTLEVLKPALLQAKRAASAWESVSLATSNDCWCPSVNAPAPCLSGPGGGKAYLQHASPSSSCLFRLSPPSVCGLFPELHICLPPLDPPDKARSSSRAQNMQLGSVQFTALQPSKLRSCNIYKIQQDKLKWSIPKD